MARPPVTQELQYFQCPDCAGELIARRAAFACTACGKRIARADGIVDFVGGQFDTRLDPHQYDADHGINDDRSAVEYRLIRRLVGDRWPDSLGTMVEIGCGTGAFSRAVLAKETVDHAVLTDVSLDMLQICRAHLQRVGVASRVDLSFASYSSNERCLRDASFDICAGIQVLHHILDYEAFLEDLFRFLKPGGIAFFAEPALRFHLALAAAVADIVALQLARDPQPSQDRQLLHNWIGEQRRGTLHQGALQYLERLEDKHMFVPEEFAAAARRIGFATVESFPLAPDPTATKMCRGLFGELGLTPEGSAEAVRLLPKHARPYFEKLAPRDRTSSYLFWLTKPARASKPRQRQAPVDKAPRQELDIMPAHWFLQLRAQPGSDSLTVDVEGWCLLNSDIKWLRVQIDGVSRDTPVWYPRADVHAAFNSDGTYAAWNSLCCGVTDRLVFDGVFANAEELPMRLELVLMNGITVDMQVNSFRPAQPLFLKL